MFGKHPAYRGKVVAVADIGSASAAVALVALHAGAPAEVLAAERSILPMEERSKEATIAQLGEHLVQAGEKVAKAYTARRGQSPAVGELYCIVRAPFVRSTTVQAVSVFETDVAITQNMINALAKHALASQTRFEPKDIFEAAVIRVELNGYPTGAPIGKSARELRVWALLSDCDQELRAKVQAGLQNLFPHLIPVFRSSSRAVLSALHDRPERSDYVLADVAGDCTTFIVVRNGIVVEQRLVQEGVRSILKRVAPTGMPEETLSLIRMLEHDQCSTAACEAVQTALAKIEPELVRAYGEAMAACMAVSRLPNTLTLVVEADMAGWLAKFFSRIDFTQFTLTTQPFLVEIVTPRDLSKRVAPAYGVLLDTGVALSVALMSREKAGR